MTHFTPVKKTSSGLFGRVLLKASFLAAITSCAYPPHRAVNSNETHPRGPDDICFTFENASSPPLMGAKTRGMYNDDKSETARNWYAVMGQHEMLMKIPGNAQAFGKWMSQFDAVK